MDRQSPAVSTINVNGRQVEIFDSKIVHPIGQSPAVSPNVVGLFNIPSSRYFYLESNGLNSIPYPAISPEEQQRRDINAWQNPLLPTVYAQESIAATDPVVDLFSVFAGKRISVPADRRDRYIRETATLLQTLESQGLEIPPDRRMAEDFINYPVNRAGDYIQASRLAVQKNEREIQQYLDRIGVIHFRASEIINLPVYELFFLLSRFYGAPITEGNLEIKALERQYLLRARNVRTRKLAKRIPEHVATFRRLQQEFDLFFDAINADPDNPEIATALGAGTQDRLYKSFFAYLLLLRRPDNLPDLTLNTIKQLRATSRQALMTFLSNYRDDSIIRIVGTAPNSERTRIAFLTRAADILLESRTFLLTPSEANLCNNPESISTLDEFANVGVAFIGRGSLATGFDCYLVTELFETWNSNTSSEGVIVFKDPLHYQTEFRVADLRAMKDAVNSGRGGVPASPQIAAVFDDYIRQAELQTSSDFQVLRRLRSWTAESPQNRALMRQFWVNYFEMGMYMRQWNGPGHPYPIQREATGREAEVGSQTEEMISRNVYGKKVIYEQTIAQMPVPIAEAIRGLTIMKNVNGLAERDESTVGRRYRDVIERGNYCIRMASSPWAFTGAYYLKQIVNEDIPGYDLAQAIVFIY